MNGGNGDGVNEVGVSDEQGMQDKGGPTGNVPDQRPERSAVVIVRSPGRIPII